MTKTISGGCVMAAIVVSAGGCFGPGVTEPLVFGEATRGERDHAWFQANSSYGCTFLDGCALDRPLLVGVAELIAVTRDRGGAVAFESSDPAVFTVGAPLDAEGSGVSVEVTAVGVGDAHLIMRRADGRVADQVELHVRTASAFEVETVAPVVLDGTRLTVPAGESGSVAAVLRDADGGHLLANQEVVWTVESTGVAHLYQFLESGPTIAEDRVYVTGDAEGTTRLTGRAGGMEIALELVVLPARAEEAP
jgi:hypothetical protein